LLKINKYQVTVSVAADNREQQKNSTKLKKVTFT